MYVSLSQQQLFSRTNEEVNFKISRFRTWTQRHCHHRDLEWPLMLAWRLFSHQQRGPVRCTFELHFLTNQTDETFHQAADAFLNVESQKNTWNPIFHQLCSDPCWALFCDDPLKKYFSRHDLNSLCIEETQLFAILKLYMSDQVTAWPFCFSQRDDKPSIQPEWHFIHSAATLSPGVRPQFLPFTALSPCPHRTAIIFILLSSWLLSELRLAWRYCTWDNWLSAMLRWGQGFRWSHHLCLHSAGTFGLHNQHSSETEKTQVTRPGGDAVNLSDSSTSAPFYEMMCDSCQNDKHNARIISMKWDRTIGRISIFFLALDHISQPHFPWTRLAVKYTDIKWWKQFVSHYVWS